MSLYRSVIAGIGSYLPERLVSNVDLCKTVDTTDEWIVERTGIRQRYIAADGELTSDLAFESARDALKSATMDSADIDLIVLATTTPDSTFPATAVKVQERLGITHGAAFDVQAVCTGFIYALSVADNALRLGQARSALVIGAETFTRLLDWEDRGTCVLFGDGAGAVVLRAEKTNGDARARGVLSTHLHSDGRLHDILYVDGGPSSTQTSGYVRMAGREVFRHAVAKLAEAGEEALAANGFGADDVDWLVPHQANKRIIDSTVRKLGLPMEKVVLTVGEHANTSAASIPLALAAGAGDGRIREGHLVLLGAMGGGLTWGSSLLRW